MLRALAVEREGKTNTEAEAYKEKEER